MDERQGPGAGLPEQDQNQAVMEAPAPPKRRIPSQYVATAVVLCVSAATLAAMRKWGMNEGLKYEHANLTEVSAQTPIVDNAKFGKVMERLATSSTPLQVSAEHIVKDPFILDSPREERVQTVDDSAERERQRLEAERLATERRRQEVQSAFERLSLQTVIMGRIPAAKINNQIVGIGEMVERQFLVMAIDAEGVTLEADGTEFRLLVDTMVGGSRPGGRSPSPTSGRPPRRP